MVSHTTACVVALLIGVIAFALTVVSIWLGEAFVFFRNLLTGWTIEVTREDNPFWFWSSIIVYVIVGILFIYGGIDGLVHGNAW